MTGTGIVPPDDFTLVPGDKIRITIDPIGTLENVVVQGGRARGQTDPTDAARVRLEGTVAR